MSDDKKVFWTTKVERIKAELFKLGRAEKLQYRTDMKALMCRGIKDEEVANIKQGLHIENSVFCMSRAYVPFRFYRLFKMGVFKENFTFGEFKYVMRVMLMMFVIDSCGHLMFKWWTNQVYNTHIHMDEEAMSKMRKKQMEDYVT